MRGDVGRAGSAVFVCAWGRWEGGPFGRQEGVQGAGGVRPEGIVLVADLLVQEIHSGGRSGAAVQYQHLRGRRGSGKRSRSGGWFGDQGILQGGPFARWGTEDRSWGGGFQHYEIVLRALGEGRP